MSEFDPTTTDDDFEDDGFYGHYGDPYYEGYYDQYDYEPNPYDGTYSEM